jgi:hypothetical protein
VRKFAENCPFWPEYLLSPVDAHDILSETLQGWSAHFETSKTPEHMPCFQARPHSSIVIAQLFLQRHILRPHHRKIAMK